jgi:hypothetical protein
MKKIIGLMLVTMVLAGYSTAAPLVYDDFESYVYTDDVQVVWHGFDEDNPSFVSVLNTTDSHGGSQCMELQSPLTPDSDWGVQIGQKAEIMDISGYNMMKLWIMSTDVSQTWGVAFELRDSSGVTIGSSPYGEDGYMIYTDLQGDGEWYEASIELNGEGDFSQLNQVLLWFNPDSGIEAGIPQFYVDDITFDTIPEPATLAIMAIGGLLLRRKK